MPATRLGSHRSEKSLRVQPTKEVTKGSGSSRDARKKKEAVYTGPLVPKSAKAGKLLASKESYKGHVFSVWTDTVLEPGATKPYTRDVVRHNGSVVVLAIDERTSAQDPEVMLIRQYRHAAGQYLLELPAGRIDEGEKPLAAAKREMIEETGFRAKRWSPLARYYASPGFLCEWMQIYLAQEITEGEATPEEDERIELVRTPLSKAMEMVRTGKIQDGKTLIGLSVLHAQRSVQER